MSGSSSTLLGDTVKYVRGSDTISVSESDEFSFLLFFFFFFADWCHLWPSDLLSLISPEKRKTVQYFTTRRWSSFIVFYYSLLLAIHGRQFKISNMKSPQQQPSSIVSHYVKSYTRWPCSIMSFAGVPLLWRKEKCVSHSLKAGNE